MRLRELGIQGPERRDTVALRVNPTVNRLGHFGPLQAARDQVLRQLSLIGYRPFAGRGTGTAETPDPGPFAGVTGALLVGAQWNITERGRVYRKISNYRQ
jgi:hypothetical protein